MRASVCEEPVWQQDILSFDDKYSNNSTKGMSGAKRKIPADIRGDGRCHSGFSGLSLIF